MTGRFLTTFPRGLAALATIAVVIATGAATAQTAAVAPAYSARALHQLPNGTVSAGTVVKSGPDMRLEYDQGGTQIIQIIRRDEGVMLMLDPAHQAYTVMQGEPSADPNGLGYQPPCQDDDPNMTCRFTGNEVTSGINAEMWEIAPPGQQAVTKILWDGARHRALRQTFPDGTVMRLTFVAMEVLEGRTAERWDIAVDAPGQAAQTGTWYYDPELRVEIREVLPGGEARWLEGIQVGPVDPALFEPPEGWTKIDMPAQPMAPPGGGN